MDSNRCLTRSLIIAAALLAAPLLTAQTEQLDTAGLRQLFSNLGYTLNDLDKDIGKFEFTVQSTELVIPIAAEISASKNYIWLTVKLGENRPSLNHEELLKQNSIIQPNFFYITRKNNFMMGTAMANRSLSPTDVRRIVEKLMSDVQSTRQVWDVQ